VTVALVALSALAAACVQATTGLGFALVLTPAAFALLRPEGAIVAVTVLGIVLNVLVLAGERRRPVVAWREVVPMLLAAAPGAVCGVLVLRALPKPVLQIAVGLAVIGAALLRVRAGAGAVSPGSRPARIALGFASGTLTTSAGVNGPPIALWLTRRGLGPAEVRDSLSAAFLGLGVIGAVALVPVLDHAKLSAGLLLASAACVVAGHAVGSRAFARLEARRYEPLLLAVILAAGAASVVGGAIAAT
jgi:uncharacterized protein